MTRAIAESDGRNDLDTDGDGKGDGESSRRGRRRESLDEAATHSALLTGLRLLRKCVCVWRLRKLFGSATEQVNGKGKG